MRGAARKRSGAALLAASGVVAVLGVVSLRHVEPAPDVVEALRPVAIARDSRAWQAGVHAHPLKPGQALAFDFGRPVSPDWTMAGVPYPLRLYAVGSPAGVRMQPCAADAVGDCPRYRLPVTARWWVELRPSR